MKKILLILSLFSAFFITNTAHASHVSGGDITYECIGPNQYEVTLTLHRDCSGITMSTSASVTFSNTCGLTSPGTLTLTLRDPNNLNNTCSSVATCNTEVSQLCPAQAGSSTCNGGSLPGMQEYIYKGIVTFPSTPCNSWTVAYSLNARNASTNVTNSSSLNLYTETTINTLNDPCNNSAVFTAQPIPYICINTPVSYNLGTIDPDGDSLYYSLVSAKSAAATNVTYNGGYSGTAPMPGMTINSSTGELNFTPTLIGNFIIVVQVEEFDFFGASLGTVKRDFQFIVQSCSNNPPDISSGAITNFSGTATQTGSNTIQMCAGESFTFDAIYTDPNLSDNLTLTTNITSTLPGSSFSFSGTNPLTGTFSWIAPSSPGQTYSFTVTINDGACPVPGINSYTYTISVGAGAYAGPDHTICTGNSVQIQSLNTTNPIWTSISGDPIIVGTNIDCDTCANPIVSPTQTTTYLVTSDSVAGLCNFTDTVIVTVLNALGPQIPDTTVCPGQVVNIDVGAGYTNYSWSPACCVGQFATITVPGTYIVSVDTLVCTMVDTFVVSAAPAPSPTITGNDFYCNNDLTTLGVSGNYSSYTWSNGDTTANVNVGIGTYTVTVTDPNSGCTGTSPAVTVTNSNPQATINLPDTVCPGDYTMLSVSPTFSGYTWFNGDTNSTTSATGGNVNVIVTDNFGCKDTAYSTVYTYPTPNAAFSINPPIQGQPGVPITFTDLSSGNPISWLWSFGDGNGSSVQNPTHIYTSQGIMDVTLLVTSAEGCQDNVTLEYLILSDIVIPNVFTPNGDGYNDFLVFKNLEFIDNNLQVFNRWGTKIYEKENYKNEWDGDGVSDGTYYFILEIKNYDDSIEVHKGTITILRN